MKLVLRSFFGHLRNFTSNTLEKRHNISNFSRQYRDHILFVWNRIFFVLASMACSALILRFDLPKFLFTDINSSPPVVNAETVAPVTEIIPDKSPTQDLPDFATKASWGQDFSSENYKNIDPAYWNIVVGAPDNVNNEQQYYTDESSNIRIENGALRIIALQQSQPEGYNYSSARIETGNKQTFRYGRIDIVAKLPKGIGTWPAVWMLPANNVYADLSPSGSFLQYKNGGEIDIIEGVGHLPNINYGIAHTVSDLARHTDGVGSFGTISVPNSTTEFNKYTLLWTPTKLTFMLNDKPYYVYERQKDADYTTWPFDQPFYIIANLALGGTWGGMDRGSFPGTGIDNSSLPTSLDLKSIYYYPYTGS